MIAVADDVWLLAGLPGNVCNAYVIGDVLVDARTRHAARSILRQVRGLDLRAHALTHAHIDHMGASHRVCTELAVPLMCGEDDAALAESGCHLDLHSKPWPVRLEHRLLAGPGHAVATTLKEGDSVGGFTVIETPGHSAGHLSFWREGDRALIVGDVLFNLRPPGRRRLMLAPDLLTPDPAANRESARRLAALRPEVICFGHGAPLYDGAHFRRRVEELTAS